MSPARRARSALLLALLLCAPGGAKTFFNTTDASVRSDSLIREQNIVLPRRIDSLIREERLREESEARDAAAPDSSAGAATSAEAEASGGAAAGSAPGTGPGSVSGTAPEAARESVSGKEPASGRDSGPEPFVLPSSRAETLSELARLEEFERRRVRPARISGSGWGAWAAALWNAGWSAGAIREAADEDLRAASRAASGRRTTGAFVGRDPGRPESGGNGLWERTEIPLAAEGRAPRAEGAIPFDCALRERALLRLRALLGSAAWDRRTWNSTLEIRALRADGELVPVGGLYTVDETNAYRRGNPVALFEAVALSLPSACAAPRRLRDGDETAEFGGVPASAPRSGRWAGATVERPLPARGADSAAARAVRLDLSGLEGALQDHFRNFLPGQRTEATLAELDSAMARASRSGFFSGLRLEPARDAGNVAAAVFASPSVPVRVGAGPWLFWPAGALVWARAGAVVPAQVVFDFQADGWWGDWNKGASARMELRSSSLSGFAFGASALHAEIDHSGWDESEDAVAEETRTRILFDASHGRRWPVRIRVAFDRLELFTALAAEAKELVGLYGSVEESLGPDKAAAMFPGLPVGLEQAAKRRTLDGVVAEMEWGSAAPRGSRWSATLGVNSYGGSDAFSFEAPLVARVAAFARREARAWSFGRVGIEAAAGADLSADAMTRGELKIAKALPVGFSVRDPALDLAVSQRMGLGLAAPLRLADDMARAFSRAGGDFSLGTERVFLKLGAGVAYRRLPRGMARTDELQKALLAELNAEIGPVSLRWGWEHRVRVGSDGGGKLSLDGPSSSDDRLLIEAMTAPF